MIVEDGTGIANANSYGTLDGFGTWLADRGLIFAGDAAPALVRGTAYVESFRARFPGTPLKGRAQGLFFPAVGGVDYFGQAIPSNAVPREVVEATYAAAYRDVVAGSLMPDQSGAGAIKREWIDGVGGTEYAVPADGSYPAPRFPEIESLLFALIGTAARRAGIGVMVV